MNTALDIQGVTAQGMTISAVRISDPAKTNKLRGP
jgi:hypothetical protein